MEDLLIKELIKQAIGLCQEKKYNQALECFEEYKIILDDVFKGNKELLAEIYKYMGDSYFNTNQVEKALTMHTKSYLLRKKVFGKYNSSTLEVICNLVEDYAHLNQFEHVLEFQQESYEVMSKLLGENNFSTLVSLSNLAHVYNVLKQYDQAVIYWKKSFEANRKFFGDNHPNTLSSLSNIANNYYRLGQYNQAVIYMQKCYTIWKRVFGNNHPDTLLILSNLAFIYACLGQYDQALVYDRECYETRKLVFGEDSPNTLISLNNLALDYHRLGQYDLALSYDKKCYEKKRKVYGEWHPYTLTSLNNLAMDYNRLGQFEQSIQLQQICYETSRIALGEDSLDTWKCLDNLGSRYGDIGDYNQALLYHGKCYQAFKRIQGEYHPETLVCLNDLAMDYFFLGQYDQSLIYHQKCYKSRKMVLGEYHPDTLSSMNNLALNYNNLGYCDQAIVCYQKCYGISIKVLGKYHPETLTTLNNLANAYNNAGQYEQAVVYNVKCYEARRKTLGEEHPDTLISLYNLSYLYVKQKDFNQFKKYVELYFKNTKNKICTFFIGCRKYHNPINNLITISRTFIKYYFALQKNDDYNYIIAYKNIVQDIEFVRSILMRVPEYGCCIKNIESIDEMISQTADMKVVNELLLKKNNFIDKLVEIYKDYSKALYLDITIDMIKYHLEEDDVLMDIYHLEDNIYGIVSISRKIFENKNIIIDSYDSISQMVSSYSDEYKHIYICPDGELYNVSFERYIKGYDISYLSSPKELLREEKQNNKEDIISFVSPDFDSNLCKSEEQRGQRVGKLYGSYLEGLYIKEIYGSNCCTFDGKNATSTNFLSIKNPKILHISTHGQYNHDDNMKPMNKGKLLFAEYNTTRGKAGYVTAQDISNMNLKDTDLIVLSACNTGLGESIPGEGVYGLRRAFELAGAKTLLLTVEEIDDFNAVIFMKVFYEIYSKTNTIYKSFKKTKEYLSNMENALKELMELKDKYQKEMLGIMNEMIYKINIEELERRIDEVKKRRMMIKRSKEDYVEEDWMGFIIQGNIHIQKNSKPQIKRCV